MVFYRKYRPQTIAELDSPKLRETLTAVLSQKEIPHAYLFTGPKGLGKTSTARIIAKVLNCTSPKRNGIEPCNTCDQCVSITNGNNIDVLEIDGASNRGIDEIRELRERVNLAPSSAKMKVYIIDEVHMLTNEAFNALLKTIEEPPAHVVFIFATTEPQKVPATIISRCFHVSLARATKEELLHALKRIVKEEKIDIQDDALQLVAEMGDGGYRDATKILEEIVALAGDKTISKEFIEKYNNTTGVVLEISELFNALCLNNVVNALFKIKAVVDQGVSMKYFIEQSLLKLHEMLLGKVGTGEYPKNMPDFSLEDISSLINSFSQAYQQVKYAPIPSLPLELAVVTWCQQEDVPSENSSSPSDKPTMKETRTKEQNLKVKQVLSGIKPEVKKPVVTSSVQTDLPKDAKDNAVLLDNIIYKIKEHNVSVAGVLRSCVVQSVSDDSVVFQTAYTFHKERLEDGKSRELLERVLKEITGKNLRASVQLKTK